MRKLFYLTVIVFWIAGSLSGCNLPFLQDDTAGVQTRRGPNRGSSAVNSPRAFSHVHAGRLSHPAARQHTSPGEHAASSSYRYRQLRHRQLRHRRHDP